MDRRESVVSKQVAPEQLPALLEDLRLLDERLQVTIERLRRQLGEEADPAHRGLIIEEADVDGWLQGLGADDVGGESDRLTLGVKGAEGGRLAALGSLFNLNPFERGVLLTLLAPEIDLAYANLYAYVQDDVTKKHATVDLVLQLWCNTLQERLQARILLGPDGALRRNLLVTVDDTLHNSVSLLTRSVTLDSRIALYLLGADLPDPALAGALAPAVVRTENRQAVTNDPVPSLERLANSAIAQEANKAGTGGGLVVWLRGPERMGKRLTAERLAARLGRPLLTVNTPALALAQGNLRNLFERALREARIQGAVLYWERADSLAARHEDSVTELPHELGAALSQFQGCTLLDMGSVPVPHLSGPLALTLDFPTPSNERRRLLWDHALNGSTRLAEDVDLQLLTGAFRLTGDQIEGAAASARHAAEWRSALTGDGSMPEVTMRDLMAACRAHSNQGLGMLARKITPRYTWDDLVLPADRLSQLHEMCYHVKFGPMVYEEWGFDRKLAAGKGLNVLFAGHPGTGKTMAAEVLATDLGLEIYKIDLSSVVSKYIGETEKNLEKIFREGQTSNAILFFDEADSLFGKRSEVKDSHDRYANIEISYLLQRMEEYDGIVILATNLRKNLDEAFVRRLHGAIEFPMPEEEDRLQIWQRTFPVEAPLSPEADLGYLAKKFKLSGGNIKNIVLESAFLAAEGGSMIEMVHLVRATRREHQKIGKLITGADFGPYRNLVKAEEQTV